MVRQKKLGRVEDKLRAKLAVAVETCYIEAPLEEIVTLLDDRSRERRRHLLVAGLFVVEKKLYQCQWVVEQNKAKGVAPGRALLVERAVEAIPTELPPVVRGLLVRCFRRNGSRRAISSEAGEVAGPRAAEFG